MIGTIFHFEFLYRSTCFFLDHIYNHALTRFTSSIIRCYRKVISDILLSKEYHPYPGEYWDLRIKCVHVLKANIPVGFIWSLQHFHSIWLLDFKVCEITSCNACIINDFFFEVCTSKSDLIYVFMPYMPQVCSFCNVV